MGTIPTLEQCRDYVKVPATALSDEDLERMRQACLQDQAALCAWPDMDSGAYPESLAQALFRRIQREVAARNLPLGMVGLEAEYGPASIPAYDALVVHHEAPWRKQVLA